MIIIGSKAGADTNPDWVHNLRANPGAHIEVGADAYDVTSRELPRAERDELFDKVVAAAPGFGEYQSKTSRIIPLFELTRASTGFLEPLDDGGVGHATRFAHRLQRVAAAALLQRVDHRGHDPHAAGAERDARWRSRRR